MLLHLIKKMKLSILFVVALAISGSLYAQPGMRGGTQPNPSEMVRREKEELLASITGLSDMQKNELDSIYNKLSTELTQNFKTKDREMEREKMEESMEKKENALKEILTKEQYKELMSVRPKPGTKQQNN